MTIVNCTPHAINLITDEGVETFEPSGIVPRLRVNIEVLSSDPVRIIRQVFRETQDLPEQIEGTLLIVSALVAKANKNRSDLVIPGELVRDEEGHIKGCRSFAVVS